MGATARLASSDTAVGAQDAHASNPQPVLWEGAIPLLLRAAALSVALVAVIALVVMAGFRALS